VSPFQGHVACQNLPLHTCQPPEYKNLETARNLANFVPCIVQFDWLISDQLGYSLNIYQFDCSVLRFSIESSSNKSNKFPSCFIFVFEILKIKKLKKKELKRATVGSSREIWCSNRETGRFDEKLGDSWENRESWQVCP